MALEVYIKKKLGDFVLNIEFSADKQCMGILGASGCGKSMMLKCIAGIETPDEGRIVLDGRELFDSRKKINMPPQKRNIGYLFQNYALFPSMTVEENICVGIRAADGINKKERQNARKAIVSQYVQQFHLQGLEKHYPSQLSGGQQQRVALARMLAAKPEMILLDEPFSALDAHLKDAMQREMAEIINLFDGHVLVVSHSRDEIYKLCPQLAIMDGGKLIYVNETKAVFDNPVYVQAARLTGCKNISPVRKIGDYQVEALDWGICLCTAQEVSDEITHIGIRAHHFMPSDGSGTAVNEFQAELVDTIEAPFEVQYFIRNKQTPEKQPMWWKVNKHEVNGKVMAKPSDYAAIAPKDIMLLREN